MMGAFDNVGDKAKDLAEDHPDQAKQGVDKAGDFADDKTGGKYSDQIDTGQEKVGDAFGGGGDNQNSGGDQNANG